MEYKVRLWKRERTWQYDPSNDADVYPMWFVYTFAAIMLGGMISAIIITILKFIG